MEYVITFLFGFGLGVFLALWFIGYGFYKLRKEGKIKITETK